jgi:uncharacterized protein (TIGR03000 family)
MYGGTSYAPAMYGSLYVPAGTYTVQSQSAYPPSETPNGARPATIVVNLPADARLKVDSTQTRSTTGRRVFVSPPLEPGRDFSYTLRAEIDRDGQTLATTRDVTVRAGQTSEVTLEIPATTDSARR